MENKMDGSGFLCDPLTKREQNILAHLANGRSNQEIAGLETLEYSSVKWYIHQIYVKLQVNRRSDAITRARELGLLRPEPVSFANTLIVKNNLPRQLTSFIGRKEEIAQLLVFIQELPLVTLTGSGGTGKTRLALQVADRALEAFPDGVWWIDLAPLADPGLVPLVTATALGLREIPHSSATQTLGTFIGKKKMLMILDNCEHLVETAAPLASDLLSACPNLHILATSLEILCVGGEMPFRCPPLSLPDQQSRPNFSELAQFDAIRLFTERAQTVSPSFRLTEANAPVVLQVCHQLDGIPLAIELAAARVRLLRMDQIAARLDNVFHLLTGGGRTALPRHQTLRATLDWSYELLSVQEQILLRRLSVFGGRFTLASAEAVCVGEGYEVDEILDLISSLVNKSIVIAERKLGQETLYRLLEMVRQYAHEKLSDAGESEFMGDCHLAYYLELAEQAEPHLRGKGMIDWLNRLEDEYDNLRVALDWSLVGHLEDGMRLASSLMWFWHIRSYLAEGVTWLEKLLTAEALGRGSQRLEVGNQSTAYLRAWCRAIAALNDLAIFHSGSLTSDRRITLLEESIVVCRAIGQDASRELAFALQARCGFMSLDVERSNQYVEEALGICRQNGYLFYEEACLQVMFNNALDSGEIQQAKEYAELSLSICRQIEDLDGTGTRLVELSVIANLEGDRSKAITLHREGLGYRQKVGNLASYYWETVNFLYYQYDPESVKQAEATIHHFQETQNHPPLVDCLVIFIEVEWSEGNFDRAERFGQEAAPIIATHSLLSYYQVIIRYYLWLGRLALTCGYLEQARQNFIAMLSWVKVELGVKPKDLVYILDALAVWCAAVGHMAQAAQVFGAEAEMYQRFAPGLLSRQRSEHDTSLATTRTALGEEAFAQNWQAGQALTLWQALGEVKRSEGWEDNHA